MTEDTAFLNSLWSALFIEELFRCGVRVCCMSPGSRCGPLTAAAASHPNMMCVTHFDERGAAFYALGRARAAQRPVALICTSGTATANYLPAVIEASLDGVPLVVVTADRPPERHDTGANQCIDQVKMFATFVRWQVHMPCPTDQIRPEFVLSTVDQAIYRTRRAPRGPVHINCMFRKPLLPESETADISDILKQSGNKAIQHLQHWTKARKPYTTYTNSEPRVAALDLEAIAARIRSAERGLLVVGRLQREEDVNAVRYLIPVLGWPVYADITSGCRLGVTAPQLMPFYDHLLHARPECALPASITVLHIGGRMVTENLYDALQAQPDSTYIVVNSEPGRLDPAHQVTMKVDADIVAFCGGLADTMADAPAAECCSRLVPIMTAIANAIETGLPSRGPLTEPVVARCVSRQIPVDAALFVGNSMPVRDLNHYACSNGNPTTVAANRGASGIDGSIATAAGLACETKGPTTAIVGDLALLHDLNSLQLAAAAGLVIIVINNNGGGIFSFLPEQRHTRLFEACFGTPHGLTFDKAAAMFDLDYHHPGDVSAFSSAYTKALTSDRGSIIEITTDRAENLALHLSLNARILASIPPA